MSRSRRGRENRAPVIIDCFMFFSELDLLELRLAELDPVVDRFVIAEAPVTHAGRPKPLVFADHRRRFAPWNGKIVHVIVDDMPSGPDAWRRENHQRNAVARGLAGASPDDGIIVSDLDEIPSAKAVGRWSADLGGRAFDQMCCYYWLNCVGGGWAGSRILPYRDFLTYADATAVRFAQFPLLSEGGWHFSYLGGAEQIVSKLEAYAHQDLNQSRFKDTRYLAQVTSLGIDLFGRSGVAFRFRPLDEQFPSVVLANRRKFAHLYRDAMFHEDWYPDDQILRLTGFVERVRRLTGAVVEIGCWEGKSTIALANAWYPEQVLAVDTWQGSLDESPSHATVVIATQRDVYSQFLANVQLLTKGNVTPVRQDCHAWLEGWGQPLKFVHIDASHDYRSVSRTIAACLPRLVPGGVLCGDDFQSADLTRRDLDGGVERAVRELLPGFEQVHNLWIWQQSGGG